MEFHILRQHLTQIRRHHNLRNGTQAQRLIGVHQLALITLRELPLFRFDPRLAEADKNPFQLDSRAPSIPLEEYVYREGRYRMLKQSNPEAAAQLLDLAKEDIAARWATYSQLAQK